jgi:CcmD family protein
MGPMTPLLIVALVVWAGLFAYFLYIDRRVSALEKKLEERRIGLSSQNSGEEKETVR